jgi:LacI family transcriptional regulator
METVTIKDLAKELNISPSTVSRALADNPLVKESTRTAVKELADQLNYRPNFTALSLKNNQTRTIGVIIPQFDHEFFGSVIRGIEDVGYKNGYSVLVCSSHESYEREVRDTNALLTGRVDGLLVCISSSTSDYDHFMRYVERGIPLGFFDCVCEDIDTHKVIVDDFLAAKGATDHLIEQGCKKLAYIGGPFNLQINKDRHDGFVESMNSSGLPADSNRIIHTQRGSYEEGMESLNRLLETDQPDGLFCGTDMLAVGAMKALKKIGLNIPNDVAVVGFSNWSVADIYEPSLTTVGQPGYLMGVKSAELIIETLKNPKVSAQKIILETELIIRDSSKRL